MSSGFVRAGSDFTTIKEEVATWMNELERKIESGGNARSEEESETIAELQKEKRIFDDWKLNTSSRLDATSQNYEGMKSVVG